MLSQLQQDHSQVMFDLDAMQVHRHFNFCDDILSVEHPPTVFHIQDLDGKNIGRLPQLIPRKEKRRGLLLLHAPPFHHVCHTAKLFDAQRVENANHIEIRVSGTKIPSRSRAVQYDAFQVRRCEFFQPVHQLPQFCIRGQHFTLLPSSRATSFPRPHRLLPHRRSLHRPSPRLPIRLPNSFASCPTACPAQTNASRCPPARRRATT